MKFNLDLPYKKLPNDAKTAPDLTRIVIRQAVALKYRDAIPRSESRMWARIQDEFDAEQDTIEIDGTQFDWLADIVDKTDMPPLFSSWLWTVRNWFEEEKKRQAEKPKQAVKSA